MAYEEFAIKDLRIAKIAQNARKFGISRLSNEDLIAELLSCKRVFLNSKERELVEEIFVKLIKIEEQVQLSG